jgi:enamine deaminase RidA (YjgF/YER057c/UK114 family)
MSGNEWVLASRQEKNITKLVLHMNRQIIASGSPFESSVGFSRAVRVGNVVFVSASASIGPDGATVGAGNPSAQARRCLEVIRTALETAGASLTDVVRTRIFLTRIEDWQQVAKVHGEVFGSIRPASTVVQVSRFIDADWLVEIEADAVIGAGPVA